MTFFQFLHVFQLLTTPMLLGICSVFLALLIGMLPWVDQAIDDIGDLKAGLTAAALTTIAWIGYYLAAATLWPQGAPTDILVSSLDDSTVFWLWTALYVTGVLMLAAMPVLYFLLYRLYRSFGF